MSYDPNEKGWNYIQEQNETHFECNCGSHDIQMQGMETEFGMAVRCMNCMLPGELDVDRAGRWSIWWSMDEILIAMAETISELKTSLDVYKELNRK